MIYFWPILLLITTTTHGQLILICRPKRTGCDLQNMLFNYFLSCVPNKQQTNKPMSHVANEYRLLCYTLFSSFTHLSRKTQLTLHILCKLSCYLNKRYLEYALISLQSTKITITSNKQNTTRRVHCWGAFS